MAEVKGYTIVAALDYVRRRYSAAERDVIFARLSPPLRESMNGLRPFDFYPRPWLSEIIEAVVAQHSDQDEAMSEVVSIAGSLAEGATNSFLRLMMKFMTPPLFAKKLPEIFQRDNRGGRMEVDTSRLSEKRFVMTVTEVEDFAYFNAICKGWIGYAFRQMGHPEMVMEFQGSQLATRSVDESRALVRWG